MSCVYIFCVSIYVRWMRSLSLGWLQLGRKLIIQWKCYEFNMKLIKYKLIFYMKKRLITLFSGKMSVIKDANKLYGR